jgi:site-specific DNA-methyltransferase (adenine-specific)
LTPRIEEARLAAKQIMPKPKPPIANRLYAGDCLEVMRSWPDACVDHCIADPPFGIASGRGRGGSRRGLGWAFSSHVTMQEAWDQFTEEEYFRFTLDWLREVCRVVKPNGNILVFGTFHNIYLLGFILGQVLERRILNSIVWFKPNAQPNITARTLTESTEQIIWAVNETPKRAKGWTFNYWDAKELNGHRQLRNMWNDRAFNMIFAPVAAPAERHLGSHPAQKPRALMDRLVQLFTSADEIILDPFAGSGVTGLSAVALLRQYILIEKDSKYTRLARKRLHHQEASPEVRLARKLRRKNMSLNDVELNVLRQIPVPQADILDKVFEVLELVNEGVDTRTEIAEQLKMAGRQGPYYADAALALRLIGLQKDITAEGADRFFLTELGRSYLKADGARRESLRRSAVLNSPILKYISSQLGVTDNGSPVPYPPPADLQDEEKVSAVLRDFGLSGRTLGRRAKTIKSWVADI